MGFIEKTNKLPNSVRLFFNSETPRLELEKACFLYSINSDRIEDISGPVGLIFVGDFALKDLPFEITKKINAPTNIASGIAYEINKRIFNKFPEYFKDSVILLEQWNRLKSTPLVSEDEAWKKVREIEPWILEAEQEKKKVAIQTRAEQQKQQASLTNITVHEALKNYPELGEQLITSEKITLHNFPEPVRPSIKNWLAEYTFTLGPDKEKRGAVERSRYLFQNVNARNLKNDDRQRLSYILRAYDENLPITVNKSTKQVIFTATAPSTPSAEQNTAPKTQLDFSQGDTSDSGVRFSSPQQLPYERTNNPNVPNITRLEEKPKPMPKNVVNLRDTDN
jgi:hypothetical protein